MLLSSGNLYDMMALQNFHRHRTDLKSVCQGLSEELFVKEFTITIPIKNICLYALQA